MAFPPDILRLSELIADKITGGIIQAATITGGTITGTVLNAVDVIGGTVTGALFRTSTSGARTEVSEQSGVTAGLKDVRFYTGYDDTADGGQKEQQPAYIGAKLNGSMVGNREVITEISSPDLTGVPDSERAFIRLMESEPLAGGHGSVDIVGGGGGVSVFTPDMFNMSAARGMILNGQGRGIVALDFGLFSGNTNAAGEVTVLHGLLDAPHIALLSGDQPNQANIYQVVSRSAGQIVVRVRRDSTGVIASAGVAFYWLVIRGA